MIEHQQSQRAPEPQVSTDTRVQTTSKIWALTIPLVALSIPLVAITGSILVAIMALLSPALATGFVWFFGNQHRADAPKTASKSELAGRQRIAELEERLANLETINNFERRLAEESLLRQSHGEPASPLLSANANPRNAVDGAAQIAG